MSCDMRRCGLGILLLRAAAALRAPSAAAPRVSARGAAARAPRIATSKFSACLVGDSLLAGLVSRDRYAPVRDVVAEKLSEKMYSPVDVTASAVPLASVGGIERRLARALEAPPPDAVAVLGGTNDLWRRDARAVAAGLERMYGAAAEAGVHVVVGITLPPFEPGLVSAFGLAGGVERTRLAVNDAIRAAAPVLLDLAADCDADAATYTRPDGIHFTSDGYRALGARIAEVFEAALRDGTRSGGVAIYPSGAAAAPRDRMAP